MQRARELGVNTNIWSARMLSHTRGDDSPYKTLYFLLPVFEFSALLDFQVLLLL